MSDLFRKDVPLDFIKRVFEVMNDTPQHTYKVLTKQADRLFEIHHHLNWTTNIWMGISVENNKVKDRIDFLRETDAKVKSLSCEPLIGSLTNLNLEGIHWVIVGGESGRKARPMNESWVWDIKQQCENHKTSFFFK